MRDEFKNEMLDNDLRVEQACLSLGISRGEYRDLARAVFSDWEFTGEQDWSCKHFLNTMRIKARDNHSKQLKNRHNYAESAAKIRCGITDTRATCQKDYSGPF